MQALVTGGSGFIGSELIRQLVAKGIRVRALLRETSSLENLDGVVFEKSIGHLGDVESLKRAVRGVDFVFHLAGSINAQSRDEYFAHNATGTENLAHACAGVNPQLKRFVYVSSLAASGPARSRNPKTESDRCEPISAYGESKLGGEVGLKKWADSAGYSFTVVRPPVVYGPRDKGIFEFVKFANAGLLPGFPSRDESGEKYFSVIFVEDLVQGILQAGFAEGQAGQEVLFVCDDSIYTMSEILKTIAKQLERKAFRIPLPRFALYVIAGFYSFLATLTGRQFPMSISKLRELNPDYWICSNAVAKKKIQFSVQYPLEAGMKKTIAWYRENKWI